MTTAVRPRFTLTYATADGLVNRAPAPARDIVRMGTALTARAAVGEVWDIRVLDFCGNDATGNFPCFD